ncbi:MAG TPA: prepilin-type N-terminal cleavage/methylation domain-containing protein [Candidatus Saccharimonadales bacterium]|nr:prepilin-type N-terminal cleavage/methylation domain-containing protein [Candidatus Saccharimonadales bacterium]
MRKTLLKNQKGTSLIELLLYIAILSIIFVVIVDLSISSGSLKQEAESQTSLQTDASYLVNRLSYEVKNSDTITSPASLGQTSSSLVLTTGSETHTFSLSGANLLYQKTLGLITSSANLNSNLTSVSNLAVQRLGSGSGKASFKITFSLTDLKPTQQGTLTKNFEVIATTR